MATFLINASNLKKGGGLQVADSICTQLYRFPQHRFIVVLSTYMRETKKRLENAKNVHVVEYNIRNNISTLLFGYDKVLNSLVKDHNVQAVLTVFGPSRWNPHVPHLCGFARAHLVLEDSPYNKQISIKQKVNYRIWTWFFKRGSKIFYTENEYISKMIPKFFGKGVKVYTVSNYYNQVFDMPETWRGHKLPEFNGITCLSISSYYAHKNFNILVDAAEILEKEHPDFSFRFVLTFDKELLPTPEHLRHHFVFTGKIDISECPDLYRQSDIMVMPTLLECFTATYPEAMRMEVPIVTTDLEFARGLCGDAACYYSAIDPKACAEAIYKVATDKTYASHLVAEGKQQLSRFDNYKERADKLISILEQIAEK